MRIFQVSENNMEAKKISFGFSKINKKPNLLPTKEIVKPGAKVELIKCLEGQKIKLVEEKPAEQILVIPLQEQQTTSRALASLMKRRAILLGEEEPDDINLNSTENIYTSTKSDQSEDIDKQAAREILADIQKQSSSNPGNNLVLPVVTADELPLEGATVPTLDDYESIPVQGFGKALLRGMGWTEPLPNTNEKNFTPFNDIPRPKGMGLGADKTLSKRPYLIAPESTEELEMKRHAYVVILGGKHKGLYGKIEGFDEYAGKIIVKMAIGGTTEAFNEFLCQPVARKEYAEYGKCINSSKYEEYKRRENEHGQIIADNPDKDKNENNIKIERCDSKTGDYKRNKDNDRYRIYGDDKEDKKSIKRESHNMKDKVTDCRRTQEKYDEKIRSKNEFSERGKEDKSNKYKDHKSEIKRCDGRHHSSEHKGRNLKNEDSKLDHARYDESEAYYRRCKQNGIDDARDRNSRTFHSSTNIERARQRTYDVSSYSASDSYASKIKKSSKGKKSKKSKKNKYNNSTDSEITSSLIDSSSDSEGEKHRKHKRKSKKSKKHRERSRSRGRR